MDLHLTDEQAALLLAELDRYIEYLLSHRALTDEQKAAFLNLLLEMIVAEPDPLSPRVQKLRTILAKLRSLEPDPPPPQERAPWRPDDPSTSAADHPNLEEAAV